MITITKDYINYLVGIFSGSLIYFVFKIIVARMLLPKDYGLWSILSLILLYSGFLHLGLGNALIREVSFSRGKKEQVEIAQNKNTVFSSMFLISGIAAITIFILSIFFASKHEHELSVIFFIIAFIVILQQVKNYFLYYFIAEKNFTAVRDIKISSLFIIGLLSVVLVLNYSLIGLPLAIAMGYILVLIYIFNKYKPTVRFQMNMKRLSFLIKIGFPIMLTSLVYNAFLTIDKVLIFKFLGRESLGYYGIALAINGFLILFPASLGMIFFPRLSEKYGALDRAEELRGFIYTPTITAVYFMSIILGLIYLFLPAMVRMVIPRYSLGIDAGRIAAFGIMFLSVSVLAQNFLIVINKQIHYLFIILFALLFKTALIYISISQHRGIVSVVKAANIVYFAYSIFIVLFVFCNYCKIKLLESIRYIFKIYLPFAYLLAILFMLKYSKQSFPLDAGNKFLSILFDFIVLMSFVVLPFVYFIRKNLYALNINISE